MKALWFEDYGGAEKLSVREVPEPVAGPGEVLIAVNAASINSWDWELLTGKPFVFRFWGLFRPRRHILGGDVAGVVKSVGDGVSELKPGDAVFGDLTGCGFSSFAEQVVAKPQYLIKKPEDLGFAEAAALPQAGILALQGLRDIRPVGPGDAVLINGAGGGVGTFAIQMAKALGAEVTAVDSADKADAMRALGADHTIDYQKTDFTKGSARYDLVLDMKSQHSPARYARVLNPGGAYAMVGGTLRAILATGLFGWLFGRKAKQRLGLVMFSASRKNLEALARLVRQGQVKPVIHDIVPLAEAPAAMAALGRGEVIGKAVISIRG